MNMILAGRNGARDERLYHLEEIAYRKTIGLSKGEHGYRSRSNLVSAIH